MVREFNIDTLKLQIPRAKDRESFELENYRYLLVLSLVK